eukprot:356656-Chlamydomonas_euryale.AAC.8
MRMRPTQAPAAHTTLRASAPRLVQQWAGLSPSPLRTDDISGAHTAVSRLSAFVGTTAAWLLGCLSGLCLAGGRRSADWLDGVMAGWQLGYWRYLVGFSDGCVSQIGCSVRAMLTLWERKRGATPSPTAHAAHTWSG